jgi:hypothetical protein
MLDSNPTLLQSSYLNMAAQNKISAKIKHDVSLAAFNPT